MEKEQLIQLIEKSRAGDQAALEQLMGETQNRAFYHCKKLLQNTEDAEDAAQEVMIAIFTQLDQLREPAAYWGWVNQIAARQCQKIGIKRGREAQIPEDEEGNSLLDRFEDTDEQVIPEKALDNDETREAIMALVDDLPETQRMSVLYYYYDEMSVSQIAELMETSEGTVKSRLNYARKAMKEELQKEEKRGSKLYGISPIPFLLYFLQKDAAANALDAEKAKAMLEKTMAAASSAAGAAGITTAAGGGGAGLSTGSVSTAGAASTAGGAGTAAGGAAASAAAGAAAKVGVGLGAKIAAVIAAAAIGGGAIAGGVHYANTHKSVPEPSVQTTTPSSVPTPTVTPEPDGRLVETEWFTMTVPEDWVGKYHYRMSGSGYSGAYGVTVGMDSANERYAGFLFQILLSPLSEIDDVIASTERYSSDSLNTYTILGVYTDEGGESHIAHCFVSSDPRNCAENEIEQYMEMCGEVDECLGTFTPKPSVDFQPWSDELLAELTGMSTTERETREAYAQALNELYHSGDLSDWAAYYEYADDPPSSDRMEFALCDVDGDGEEELLLRYNALFEMDSSEFVLAYDPDYTGAGAPLRCEIWGGPDFTYYAGGWLKDENAMNMAMDFCTGYDLFSRYDPETDSYDENYWQVCSWDKSVAAADFNGTPFPDDVDTDGDGIVYFIDGERNGERTEIMDGPALREWQDTYMGDMTVLTPDFQPLDLDHINALLETG